MKIDRINCEAFFLDYHEKRLTPVQVAELFLFLDQNPDLKEIFESFDDISIDAGDNLFPGKISLKQWGRGELERLLALPVNEENDELYFIAFHENLLSDDQKGRVEAYLDTNPDRKKDFQLYALSHVPAEAKVFAGKELLHRELVSEHNAEEFLIRRIEGDLATHEELALQKFLKTNPAWQKEADLFGKTLLPQEKIIFEGKESLKKRERRPVFIRLVSQRSFQYAAAAAIILLAGLFWFLTDTREQPVILAEQSTIGARQESVIDTFNKEATVIQEIENIIQPETQIPALAPAPEKIQSPSLLANNIKENVPVKNIATPAPKFRVEELDPMLNLEEEEASLLAQAEPPSQNLMPEEETGDVVPSEIVTASSNASTTPVDNNEYQTMRQYASKKLRRALGVKESNNACDDEGKFGWWEVALAAKNGIQGLVGSKKVEMEKKCDGDGNTTEYVFMAGNFQFSAHTKKKDVTNAKP